MNKTLTDYIRGLSKDELLRIQKIVKAELRKRNYDKNNQTRENIKR